MSAERAGTRSHDAMVEMYSIGLRDVCVAGVEQFGNDIIAGDHDDALIVRAGQGLVEGGYVGVRGRRYRFAFSLSAHGRTQHRTLVATARQHSIAFAKTRAFSGVAAFTTASVQITDLTTHKAVTYRVTR